VSKREKTLAEVDDRFQLKRGRPLEGANDDRRDEWESRKDRKREREKESNIEITYIGIECGLAVSGTYQVGTLLAYLPWRTKKRSEASFLHRRRLGLPDVAQPDCRSVR